MRLACCRGLILPLLGPKPDRTIGQRSRAYRKAGRLGGGDRDGLVKALTDTSIRPAIASSVDGIQRHWGTCGLLGLMTVSGEEWFQGAGDTSNIEERIAARKKAKEKHDFAESDRIRDELVSEGILLEDGPSGTTWRRA